MGIHAVLGKSHFCLCIVRGCHARFVGHINGRTGHADLRGLPGQTLIFTKTQTRRHVDAVPLDVIAGIIRPQTLQGALN